MKVSVLDKVLAKDKKRPITPRPTNSFTSDEYAKHIGVSIQQSLRRLKELEKLGVVKRIFITVVNSLGVAKKQPGWVLVENESSTTSRK